MVDNKDSAKFFHKFLANLKGQSKHSASSQMSVLLFLQKNSYCQSQGRSGGLYSQSQDKASETPATRVNITSFKKKSKNNKDLSQVKYYSYK